MKKGLRERVHCLDATRKRSPFDQQHEYTLPGHCFTSALARTYPQTTTQAIDGTDLLFVAFAISRSLKRLQTVNT
jgi:hypothetical protein